MDIVHMRRIIIYVIVVEVEDLLTSHTDSSQIVRKKLSVPINNMY
jgi:hypothetical protein